MKPRNQQGKFTQIGWTPEQVSLLIELYPDTLTSDIAEKLGKGLSAVRNKAHNLGLKKSKEFISNNGKKASSHPNVIASQYQKGRTPENKGKKQTEFMSAEGIEKTKATRFKKGQLPHNTRQIGAERICSKDGYIYIKTELRGRFKLKHRVIWEQHHGKIPKGYNIQFKDGNRKNCHIENLYIIPRNEQVLQNSILNLPPELQKRL